MKNLITRSLSGIIYVALIVGAIFAGRYYFYALTTVFAVLAIMEIEKLHRPGQLNPTNMLIRVLDAANAVTVLTIFALNDDFNHIVLSFVAIPIIETVYFIIRIVLSLYDKNPNSFTDVARSFLSLIYIVLPMLMLNFLYVAHGSSFALIIFVMIWLNDTGAYCVGSMLGRNKLFERLSPKKSWEGFFGGLLFTVAAGAACYYHGGIFTEPFVTPSIGWWIVLGIVVCVFSTWGDLFESMMKRNLGVKDSGTLIPGHGGILDRIDSLLLVSPAVFLYTLFIIF